MSKEKIKHGNKGTTGATSCNILNINIEMLHPCNFIEVATRVQQGATFRGATPKNTLKGLINRILTKCCMLHPYFEVKFLKL